MRGKWLIAGLFALVLTQGRSLAQDQNVTYTITDLGTLGGVSSSAFGINNRGQVTGRAAIGTGESHAFLWQDGQIVDLGTLDALAFSEGFAINNHGQVAGDSSPGGTQPFSGTLWANGEIIALGSLGGGRSFGNGINNRGQVVGGSRTPAPEFVNHAFLWEDGIMTDLGTLPGRPVSIARDINNRGEVVGNSGPFEGAPDHHAFLWEKGTMTDLGTLGGIFSRAYGINSRGQVVGVSTTAGEQLHAFVWKKGTMTDLGTLGGTCSVARHINSRGQIVGGADIPSGNSCGQILFGADIPSGQEHAFLWEDSVMTDLNTLIPENSGWVLWEARGINASGQIAGVGSINGQTHAFLLTPQDD